MKKKNTVVIDNKLIAELKKYSSEVCVGLATQVRDELYDEAIFAIDEFYNDYSPISYARHYWNFQQKSFVKYYKNPHAQIVRGGVYISPDKMSEIYRAPASLVFNYVWEQGVHGTPGDAPKIMDKPPIDYVYEKRENIVNNINKYVNSAILRAQMLSYEYIRKG